MQTLRLLNGCWPCAILTLYRVFAVVQPQSSSTSGGTIDVQRTMEYSVKEEMAAGTVIGNIRQDSNVVSRYTPEEALTLRFEFRYRTQSYRYFSINERTGSLTTSQVLDRETICPYAAGSTSCDLAIDVKVKLGAQFAHMFKVVIHVLDVNDNAPVFPQESMTISIVETTQPGALFLVPVAEDMDSGLLGIQEYRLLADHDQFELKVTDHVDGTKEVRLKLMARLDRELEDSYIVTVVALDGGRPPKTGSVVINIVVLDSNDNSPQFERESYETTIHENLSVGSSIIRIHATDPDHGPNGIIAYSFADFTQSDYGEIFRIDDKTGEIYLKGAVDYETTKSYQLTVVAADLGTGSLPVFVKVTVNVLDVNDNSPVISVNVLTETNVAEVRENAEPGTFVAHTAVKDADSGVNGQTDCSIDGRGLFSLESLYDNEYKIVTSIAFDREEAPEYTVIMTCHDHAVPSLTTSVRIDVIILDENDHAPSLTSDVFVAELRENLPIGSLVTIIEATDADFGRNKALLYQLKPTENTPENTLSIDPITGKVTTLIPFDYERRHEYIYRLIVSDHGEVPRSTTATLRVYVTDANDERPRFDKTVYYFTTTENQPLGTSVGRVNATDADRTAAFRKITYSVSSGDTAFDVDPDSGIISNVRRLDREERDIYSFVIIASNEEITSASVMETKVNVSVYIDDVNDNNPDFTFPHKDRNSVQVSGQASVGSLVAHITATDRDLGRNAELSYSISSGNTENVFLIDPSTGVIILGREIEMKGSGNKLFSLVVVVKDDGVPPLMTVGSLHILANNSAALAPASTYSPIALASVLGGNNLLILIGAILGFALILSVLIVVGVLCVRRHNRKARKKYIAEAVAAVTAASSPCSHQCQSPVCSSRALSHHGVRQGGGSLSTVDTNSVVMSNGAGNALNNMQACNAWRQTVEENDETLYTERNPWSQNDTRIIANSHVARSDDGQSTPQIVCRNQARSASRERSCSPRSDYVHQCGPCQCTCSQRHNNCGGYQQQPYRQSSRPQSPELIPDDFCNTESTLGTDDARFKRRRRKKNDAPFESREIQARSTGSVCNDTQFVTSCFRPSGRESSVDDARSESRLWITLSRARKDAGFWKSLFLA